MNWRCLENMRRLHVILVARRGTNEKAKRGAVGFVLFGWGERIQTFDPLPYAIALQLADAILCPVRTELFHMSGPRNSGRAS